MYKFYDNSRISAFRECPRRYFFRHYLHWAPETSKVWFSFGAAWHCAMDVMWSGVGHTKPLDLINASYEGFVVEWVNRGEKPPSRMTMEDLDELTPRTPQICKEMLHAYYKARERIFTSPSFELVAVEQPFAVPLNPADPTRQYVGRLDKVFRYEGELRIAEHKTTTAYRKDGYFRADFLDSFSPNSQVDGYQYAAGPLYGGKLRSIWIDAALVHKTVHNGFKFIPIDRGDSALDAWLWETHHWIDQIEMNKAALAEEERTAGTYMAAFPRNTSSCFGCAFRDPCRAMANPAKQLTPPMGFKVDKWSPFSEIALEKLGFNPEEDAS